MVRCIKPQPGEVIQDPAAGTAGFLIAADQYIKSKTDDLYDLSAKERNFRRTKPLSALNWCPHPPLALMNCLLHGMEGDEKGVVHQGNALGMAGQSLAKADIILANPPFGTAKGGEASITRDDLPITPAINSWRFCSIFIATSSQAALRLCCRITCCLRLGWVPMCVAT
jgi:type I restriction enzyme M protein